MEPLAQAIEAETDMLLVDTIAEWDAAAGASWSEPIDVLITEADAGGSDATSAYTDLLYGWPRLRVLAIGAAAPDGCLQQHELQPTTLALGNVSLSGLLDAIRTSGAGASGSPRRAPVP